MVADKQDVDWHHTFDYMFASVGDDKLLNMYVACLNAYTAVLTYQLGHA